MATSQDPRNVVVGLFRDRDAAERAIRQLQAAGFPRERIGVAMRDRSAQGELIEETETGAEAVEGLAAGAGTGTGTGGVMVTVDAGSRVAEARTVFDQNGADIVPATAAAGRPAETIGAAHRARRAGIDRPESAPMATAGVRPDRADEPAIPRTWAGGTDRRAPGLPGRRVTDIQASLG